MDPLEMNDWHIKKFLAFVLTVQVLLLCLLSLDEAGYSVPFITQAAGLLCTGVVPGFLLLRIMRLHNLGTVRAFLYAAGLSVMFIMTLGALINILLPFAGITRPLDRLPLTLTMLLLTLLMAGIAFLRDRTYVNKGETKGSFSLSPVTLLLILLPLLAVYGAQVVNIRQDNFILMLLMVLLSLLPLLAILTRWLPEKLFPLAIFSTALALLLHRTLISDHLWGADILREFACYRAIIDNGVWQPSAPGLIPAYNTSLAVTILPAEITNLADIDGLWVFKLVFPVLLALVPLAMYETLRRQFSPRIAFLATFLLMSLYPFYTTFPGTAKQLVSTVFLALFLLVMTDRDLNPRMQKVVLTAFGIGVIVTHYSTAFLLVPFVIAAVSIIFVLRRRNLVLTGGVVAILLTVTITWYLLLADGAVIRQFIGMGSTAVNTVTSIPSETVATPAAVESIRLISEGGANMPDSLRALYLFTQAFICFGALFGFVCWLFRGDNKISDEFMAFAACFAGLLGLELLLPQLSLVISLDRIYPVAMLTLAPFCITGAHQMWKAAATMSSKIGLRQKWQRLKAPQWHIENRAALGLCAVFLAVFLLANTGFIYEVAGHPLPTSIALSPENSDFPVFTEGELNGAEWVVDRADGDTIFYDTLSYHIFDYLNNVTGEAPGKTAGQILYRRPDSIGIVETDVPPRSLIYLRSYNLRTGKLALGWPAYQTMDVKRIEIDRLGSFSDTLACSNVIYTSDSSQVLYTLDPHSVRKELASNER